MSLKLHFHPLASYCHKVLIALYENDTPFTPNKVDLSDEGERAALLQMWPIGKFPVLRDEARDRVVPESSIIIEYLAQHYPGKSTLVPKDPDEARQMRLRDRFFDLLYLVRNRQLVGIDVGHLNAKVLARLGGTSGEVAMKPCRRSATDEIQ